MTHQSIIQRGQSRILACIVLSVAAVCLQGWVQLPGAVTSKNSSNTVVVRKKSRRSFFVSPGTQNLVIADEKKKKEKKKHSHESNSTSSNPETSSRSNATERALLLEKTATTTLETQKHRNDGTDKDKDDNSEPCEPLEPLRWEFQKPTNSSHASASKRLLIGMYSGGSGPYADMLRVTSSVNQAYANLWGHDTMILWGVAYHLGEDGANCTPTSGVRPAFNKIRLLQYALEHSDRYDQLLLLDTDAMMYDLEYDVTAMIGNDESIMLLAHRVHKEEPERGNWDVNNGVTLWNLHHPETAGVVADWDRFSWDHLKANSGSGGDQHQLHRAIKRGGGSPATRMAAIKGTYDEFRYRKGTVIRHYIRDNDGWDAFNPLEQRIRDLKKAKERVCMRYPRAECGSIKTVE